VPSQLNERQAQAAPAVGGENNRVAIDDGRESEEFIPTKQYFGLDTEQKLRDVRFALLTPL